MKKSILGISLLTLTGLYGILVGFVLLVGILLGVNLSSILLIAIIVLVLQFLLSPFFTDLTMKWFYKAKFDKQLPDYLNNFVKELCEQHKMKFPKFGYIDDGAPNAFTYGRTKNDARIVLTRGIFELLSEEEVKAVVAHEMGHIVHYDMAFMTAAQLIPLVLYYIYEVCIESSKRTRNRNSKNDKESAAAAVGLIAYVLYLISQYIILWLSRTREYYADSYSVESTKNPNALAQALVKIGYGLTLKTTKEGKMSAAKSNALGIFDSATAKSLVVSSSSNGTVSRDTIKNAMKWEMWNKWAKWYELNSTHPLISKRLLAISKRSTEFNQIPFIVFDLQPEEDYNKHFAKEIFILLSPWLCFILLLTLILFDILPFVRIFCLPLAIVCMLIQFNFSHKNKDYKEMNVSQLLSEVKVSKITSVPCIIEGVVIGRGDPGNMFDEDFILKDETGFIFIDKKHVLKIADTLAGLFKTKGIVNKKVKIKGWYRRSPVPYVEVYEYQVEGEKTKKMNSYIVTKVMYYILLVLSIALSIKFI